MAELTYGGEQFELADKIGLMPLMRFAHLARAGVDSNDMEALDAMYTLLQGCIADEAWPRFEVVATRERADGDDLMKVVTDAIGAIAARPTGRSSDSSDGPSTTTASSPADSSSAVIERFEQKGRPDLALLVSNTRESLRATG